ncbi:MAG: SDR family oxidoreductase [Gemmatimonadaceae bacterium]
MRVFVTGATGFIGSAIVQELTQAGHHVLGLARNDAAASALAKLGVTAHRGDLKSTDSLQAAARACDGVIHTAFIHDFSDIGAAGVTDNVAIQAIGDALADSGKPFVVTSGIAHLAQGGVKTENDKADPNSVATHRIPSENTTFALAARGVRATLLRLPPSVHGDGDHGFVPAIIDVARKQGVSAYIGEGLNRWPAVHRLDAANLFRLALEHGVAGATYHGVADEGVPTKEIADVIGRRLNVPVISKSREEVAAHFGWIGHFFGVDCPASSTQTQQLLGWRPTHASLILDLDNVRYFGN